MRVCWTDRARYRLKQIRDYLDQEAPSVALPTIQRLIKRSQFIGELPSAGRIVPEYRQDDLREILESPYRIIYRILDDRIDVITVMHYRQLLPVDLNELLKPE
jgi:plasmid stabilization system protein ParE